MDASIYPVKDITPVFEYIESNGHLFQKAGHGVDRWCNDYCREYFNLSSKESEVMQLFSAGFTGLSFRNMRTLDFFIQWKEAATNGAFKGEWGNHRHDMTCASIIAHRLGMKLDSRQWFAYLGGGYLKPPDECFFLAQPPII